MKNQNLLLLACCYAAISLPAVGEGGQEYFKQLQEVRREIHRQVAPSVVRVQLVHRSIPAFLLERLDRCALECEFKPWQRGEISADEALQWKAWCDSFMSFSEHRFRSALQSDSEKVLWDVSLQTTFHDWLNQTRESVEEEIRDSLDRFSATLTAHIETLAEDLKKRETISPKPLVRDQSTGVVVREGVVVTTQNVAKTRGPEEWIRVWSDALVAYSTGEVVGVDPDTNLAVIRLSGPGAKLTPTLGLDPTVSPEIGDFTFFFYHPFNQGLAMRTGEITSLYNQLPFFHCAAFHGTSFPTSPGTLGGPVVNLDGQLVGINTVFMGQGNMSEVTYSLPTGDVLACVDQILTKGYVERGRLGVQLSEYHCSEGGHLRVSILKVLPGTPAAEMGLQQGDVIESVNGRHVNCRMEVVSQLYQSPPDREVSLEIDRGGELKQIHLKLATGAPAHP